MSFIGFITNTQIYLNKTNLVVYYTWLISVCDGFFIEPSLKGNALYKGSRKNNDRDIKALHEEGKKIILNNPTLLESNFIFGNDYYSLFRS